MSDGIPDTARAWLVRLDLAQVDYGERLSQLEEQFADLLATDTNPKAGRPGWQYRNVYEWVEQWFAIHYARPMSPGLGWCARWWEHAEALLLLTAMWRSWEHYRLEPDKGIAVWLTTIAYPLVRELFDPMSTFRYCRQGTHVKVPAALPLEVRNV